MSRLYREQAIRFQSQRLHGAILLRQSWPSLVLTLGLLTAVLLLLCLFFFFSYGPTERLVGRLQNTGSAMEAVLYGPSRVLGWVRPGSPVELRVDALALSVAGVVHEISDSPQRYDSPPGATDTDLYLLRVAVDPQTVLKPGMRVEAALKRERRKLYQWVLEPQPAPP